MNHPAYPLTSIAIAMTCLAAPAFAQTAAPAPEAASAPAGSASAPASTDAKAGSVDLAAVVITGQRANRVSNGATNLDLELKDTPQSISIVSQEQMKEFGASEISDALRLTTGLRVEKTSTNLTTYMARGFEIKNTQIDGVSSGGMGTNPMDSFGYEKVEVVRGANGLLTGIGNASGTINFVRKRPTNDRRGEVSVSYGSWDTKRVEADYSTPLTEDGSWAVRVVGAYQDGDSYLRDFRTKRNFAYVTVDGQIGEHGSLAAGISRQQSDTSGNMWGTLTFVSNTGQQLDLPRNASTTQDWTWWNDTTQSAFVEYTQDLGDDWRAKASYNYHSSDSPSQLFMGYSPKGLDPATGTGMVGWAYKSTTKNPSNLFNLSFNGHYELFGRRHEATMGVSYSMDKSNQYYNPTSFAGPAFGALPAFPYAGDAIPEPTWGASVFYTSLNQRLKRAYAVTRLTLADSLHAILGVNWTSYHRDGIDSLAVPFSQTQDNTSPYFGINYDFSSTVSAYANYSYIYQPQSQFTRTRDYIQPSKGTNYEVGVKSEWLDRRLLTTLAWFGARQQGLATYVGTVFLDGSAFAAYDGINIESKGLEFEATGKINAYTDLVLGFTHMSLSGAATGPTYPWVPRNTANLMLSTRLPSLPALSMGINARWQSDTNNADSYSGYNVRQSGYTTADVFAAWAFTPKLTLRGNVNNITNKKYINSLYIASYYAAPTNYTMSLDYRF